MTQEEQIERAAAMLYDDPLRRHTGMSEEQLRLDARIFAAQIVGVVADEMSAAMSYEDHSSWATAGWGIRGPRNDVQSKSEGNEMTREEQIEQMAQTLCAIRLEQIRTKAPHVANWDRLLESERDEWRWWATKMVDAITQPVEIETIKGKEFDSAEFGRAMDRVIVGLSTDLERLREAAQEAYDALDHIVGHTHQAHPRARTALDRLRAALEDKT